MGRINDAVGVCLCNSTVLCSAVVYSVMCDGDKCQLGLSKKI